MRQSLIAQIISLFAVVNTRLRSPVGERESGAEGAEERVAKRSRSGTPAAEPQTEARRPCGTLRMLARDERAVAERKGRGREGDGDDRKPVERSNRALVTAG